MKMVSIYIIYKIPINNTYTSYTYNKSGVLKIKNLRIYKNPPFLKLPYKFH